MRHDNAGWDGMNLEQTGPRARRLAALLATCLANIAAAAPPERYESSQVHMGMDFRVVFYADDPQAANRAGEAVWTRIAQLDQALSDYRAESELMRAVAAARRGESPRLGDDLWGVLARSQELAADSRGAFDVTVGPLTRLWRRARRQRQAPDAAELEAARAAVGWRGLELDPSNRSLRLARPGMRIDLGGIAVGYAVDEALRVLRERGFSRALVDGSGDIAVGDPPPETAGWRIRLDTPDPRANARPIVLSNGAITTASDAVQHVEIAGRRYSHVIDPRSGEPLTISRSVTVLAADCLTADGLDTALSVMDVDAGIELVDRTPGAAALIVETLAEGLRVVRSARWEALARADEEATSFEAPAVD